MYVTAQRVSQLEGAARGLNAFLYLHGERELSHNEAGVVDVDAVAGQPPGDPVSEILSVSPGGNRVLSYLDIACDDGIGTQVLAQALERFEDFVPRQRNDWLFEDMETIESIGIRLYLSPHITLAPVVEYRSLCQTAMRSIDLHRGNDSQSVLQINMERGVGERRFRPLPTEFELPGPPDHTEGVPVTIDDKTLMAFEASRGSLYPVLAESIFGLGAEELLKHGGVEIIDVGTRNIIWRGP